MFCVVRSTKKIMAAAGFTASLLLAGFAAQAASGDFMQTGKITSQPIGHYEFCKREARNAPSPAATPVRSNSPLPTGSTLSK